MAEATVTRYLDIIMKSEVLEESFAGFIVHSEENNILKMKNYEEQMINMMNELGSAENVSAAMKHYISAVGNVANDRISKMMLAMLEYAVQHNLLSPKVVCEAILTSDKLSCQNETFWCNSISLIRKIIVNVDYKGVRDLLKIILDKINQIPTDCNVALLRQLNEMYQVFEIIFDRNSSLLPGYLVLDEIQKKVCPKGKGVHWKFAKLLSSFVDSFRPTAQMVSIVGRSKLLPIIGYSPNTVWKLDSHAKFQLRGLLPYNKELLEPQIFLFKYVLEQFYSRDMVCAILGLVRDSKDKELHRILVLEEQLVDLIVSAMERSETELDVNDVYEPELNQIQLFWQHLSGHLIYFVAFLYASFPHMIQNLHDKLANKNLRKGREQLMWCMLQFLSGSIQRNQLSDYLPIMKLHDLLYPEKEPIPLPDISKSNSVYTMAASSIWIHLMKKAEAENIKLQRQIPQSLELHVNFLKENLNNSNSPLNLKDFRVSLLCNAYSTNLDCFARPMGTLFEAVCINSNCGNNSSPASPLPMKILESLTVHTKMNLVQHIANHICKSAASKQNVCLSPALIETYSRLLIYSEIESLGVKTFLTKILAQVCRAQSWGILHTLLELFIYRLHNVPSHYRLQLLGHLNTLANVPQTNQIQLHLCMENTSLRLITGLGNSEVLSIPQFLRIQNQNEHKVILYGDSEELNKAFVLTLARAIQITGSEKLSDSWIKEILSNINQYTPLNWSCFTILCFPSVISEYYQQTGFQKENKSLLKRSVEEEYRKWKSMNNENDIVKHFSSQQTPPLFLCLLWKMLLENDRINPIVYKILDRIGSRALSIHIRTFADFLVFEFATLPGGQNVQNFINAINDLFWKFNIINFDRFMLCLSLRSFEIGNEAQVCFFIIQLLLLKTVDFKNRVDEFVKENNPDHWKQSNWHEKHLAFCDKYPEKYYFENIQESSQSSQHSYFPVYFSNVCLRFLPVFDIIIHRFLELPVSSVTNVIERTLETFGSLYKFHDKPLTFLYNTLHYYEPKLKDRPQLKRKLVSTIVEPFKDIRPKNWALSEMYLQRISCDKEWTPGLDYYIRLIGRVVDTFSGSKTVFPNTDYRFNEFPNAGCHALHITCIELMALPVSAPVVGTSLLDVVLIGHKMLPRGSIEIWMNSIGIVLTALPEAYWSVLNDRILEMMQNPMLKNYNDPFELMDFTNSHTSMNEMQFSYLIALTHAIWHHATVGQISSMPQFLKEKIRPVLKTEQQLIFICHLVGPFLQRFCAERTRCVIDLTIELYEMLEIVDKNTENLRFMDPICDLLYHIKYMFTGDLVKNEVERIIRNLRPQLQLRLRFITHLNKEVTMN